MIIPKNKNILEYLQNQDIRIVAPCNGKGICGKCKVLMPTNPQPNAMEKEHLSEKELNNSIRLACSRVVEEDTEIELFKENANMNITSTFNENFNKEPYIHFEPDLQGFVVKRMDEIIGKTTVKTAFGIAIDIGTTTVVVALIDLVNKLSIDSDAFLNPQSRYGSDVISRIQFASSPEHLSILSKLIRNSIHKSILSLLDRNGIEYRTTYEVVIAANTTMVHLLLEQDPTMIAVAPYKSNMLDFKELPYQELFSNMLSSRVTVFGGFDAFVGGDILSGIYSEDLYHKKEISLLVDLGTNGEISLIKEGKIYATSTAAGPAFEGVNILCGMGAVSGAISSFKLNGKMGTIHNEDPVGICGSGLIDIVSELLKAGIIAQNGRMKQEFHIINDIKIIPADIREIQLAKAAIRAGVEHLIIDAGISVSDIDYLYIAGGFGKHVNVNHFFDLGIFPRELFGKTIIVGNSSLSGAVKYLFSPLSDELNQMKKSAQIINLGTSLRFQDLFVEHIHFKG